MGAHDCLAESVAASKFQRWGHTIVLQKQLPLPNSRDGDTRLSCRSSCRFQIPEMGAHDCLAEAVAASKFQRWGHTIVLQKQLPLPNSRDGSTRLSCKSNYHFQIPEMGAHDYLAEAVAASKFQRWGHTIVLQKQLPLPNSRDGGTRLSCRSSCRFQIPEMGAHDCLAEAVAASKFQRWGHTIVLQKQLPLPNSRDGGTRLSCRRSCRFQIPEMGAHDCLAEAVAASKFQRWGHTIVLQKQLPLPNSRDGGTRLSYRSSCRFQIPEMGAHDCLAEAVAASKSQRWGHTIVLQKQLPLPNSRDGGTRLSCRSSCRFQIPEMGAHDCLAEAVAASKFQRWGHTIVLQKQLPLPNSRDGSTRLSCRSSCRFQIPEIQAHDCLAEEVAASKFQRWGHTIVLQKQLPLPNSRDGGTRLSCRSSCRFQIPEMGAHDCLAEAVAASKFQRWGHTIVLQKQLPLPNSRDGGTRLSCRSSCRFQIPEMGAHDCLAEAVAASKFQRWEHTIVLQKQLPLPNSRDGGTRLSCRSSCRFQIPEMGAHDCLAEAVAASKFQRWGHTIVLQKQLPLPNSRDGGTRLSCRSSCRFQIPEMGAHDCLAEAAAASKFQRWGHTIVLQKQLPLPNSRDGGTRLSCRSSCRFQIPEMEAHDCLAEAVAASKFQRWEHTIVLQKQLPLPNSRDGGTRLSCRSSCRFQIPEMGAHDCLAEAVAASKFQRWGHTIVLQKQLPLPNSRDGGTRLSCRSSCRFQIPEMGAHDCLAEAVAASKFQRWGHTIVLQKQLPLPNSRDGGTRLSCRSSCRFQIPEMGAHDCLAEAVAASKFQRWGHTIVLQKHLPLPNSRDGGTRLSCRSSCRFQIPEMGAHDCLAEAVAASKFQRWGHTIVLQKQLPLPNSRDGGTRLSCRSSCRFQIPEMGAHDCLAEAVAASKFQRWGHTIVLQKHLPLPNSRDGGTRLSCRSSCRFQIPEMGAHDCLAEAVAASKFQRWEHTIVLQKQLPLPNSSDGSTRLSCRSSCRFQIPEMGAHDCLAEAVAASKFQRWGHTIVLQKQLPLPNSRDGGTRLSCRSSCRFQIPEMGAHGCLAEAVAASKFQRWGHTIVLQKQLPLPNSRDGGTRLSCRSSGRFQFQRGRSGLFTTAPDQDGRLYTPECEGLPTVQAELVDNTYGNNFERMQDSEVNFLRWTSQNRVSSALNSKNRKAQMFVPGTCVYYTRKDKKEMKASSKGIARGLCTETRRINEKEGSTGTLLVTPDKPRPSS